MPLPIDHRDGPRDECGVFGIYAPDHDVARLATVLREREIELELDTIAAAQLAARDEAMDEEDAS